MAHIPSTARWYLAEIVEEFTINCETNNVVHTNWVLIRADNPEEAYELANVVGAESNITYTNPNGQTVTVAYRGLRDLNVIHGELEHGTELTYEKRTGMAQSELINFVSKKEELGVFKEPDAPNDDSA